MTFRYLDVDDSGPVGWMRLARPDKLNALSDAFMLEIIEAAGRLSDSTVRTVVVAGEGAAFCVGYDLAGLQEGPVAEGDEASRYQAAALGGRMADAVEQMRPVTVAVLHGHVIGGGLVLAAACDLRVAAERTVFSIPEIDLGIPLAWDGIDRLVRELGPALTKELVMTCRPFSAEEVRAAGFLNRVVPDGEEQAAAVEMASTIAAKPRYPIETTKRHVAEVLLGDRSRDDAADLLAALEDPECMEARREYLFRVSPAGLRSRDEPETPRRP